MAITEVLRTFNGEGGSATQEIQKYLVKTDDKTCQASVVRAASAGGVSIPAEGSFLEGTPMTAPRRGGAASAESALLGSDRHLQPPQRRRLQHQ
jgi:hypothetical protein